MEWLGRVSPRRKGRFLGRSSWADTGPRLAGLLALLVLAGCGLIKRVSQVPERTISAVVPGKREQQVDPADLQQRLLGFADDAMMRTSRTLDQYAAEERTEAAETEVLRWKLTSGTATMLAVSGPNPHVNLLNVLAITTLRRLELESLEVAGELREGLRSLLPLARALETNAWHVAEGVLTPAQSEELRANIEAWHVAHPPTGGLTLSRPQEYAQDLLRLTEGGAARPDSFLSLLTLDPLLGLDPAVREVTQTRLFAERAMHVLQRMPTLLRWQTELLTRDTLQLPELQAIVTNTSRLSASMDRISHTAEALPDRLSKERQQIMAELETQEAKLHDLAVEVRHALEAGQGMSASLGATLTTFDALMKRFGVGEPRPPATAAPSKGRPFDILDYATTAKEIAAMAAQLDATLKELGAAVDSPALAQRKQDLEEIVAQAEQRLRSSLNHAFLLAAGLLLLAFAGALTYRWLAARFLTARPGAGASDEL